MTYDELVSIVEKHQHLNKNKCFDDKAIVNLCEELDATYLLVMPKPMSAFIIREWFGNTRPMKCIVILKKQVSDTLMPVFIELGAEQAIMNKADFVSKKAQNKVQGLLFKEVSRRVMLWI